tara:strand:- start:169 stop:396 length:228 start_codon:yes stop_codon:yes gene_type:complete
MAVPGTKLHQEKPSEPYKCGMCQDVSRKSKFLWKSYLNENELFICRECAYKEKYGTKGMKQAKKERLLEQKETNQ